MLGYNYRAIEPIMVENCLAFAPGDLVPDEHVKTGVVSESSVVKVGTKADEQYDPRATPSDVTPPSEADANDAPGTEGETNAAGNAARAARKARG